ncbi:Translin-1 [Xanthoria calcicola]
MAGSRGMIDPAIFEQLQANIDDDSQFRDEVRNILQKRERQVKEALKPARSSIDEQIQTISELGAMVSKYPYYKYNHLWTRHTQETIRSLIFGVWLGVYEPEQGTLLTIKEVGSSMNVPVDVKDRDVFHITTEEYLLALTDLIEELARLAVNSVTLGDFQRPLQISKFVKELHAGFQILNMKNDVLRRKSDGIKYSVKKIEDVVYDLSLRNLIPRNAS